MLRDAYLLCDLFVFPPFDLFLAWQYDIVSTSTWIFILKHIGQHLSGFTPQQAIFHLSGKCYVLCANLQNNAFTLFEICIFQIPKPWEISPSTYVLPPCRSRKRHLFQIC